MARVGHAIFIDQKIHHGTSLYLVIFVSRISIPGVLDAQVDATQTFADRHKLKLGVIQGRVPDFRVRFLNGTAIDEVHTLLQLIQHGAQYVKVAVKEF